MFRFPPPLPANIYWVHFCRRSFIPISFEDTAFTHFPSIYASYLDRCSIRAWLRSGLVSKHREESPNKTFHALVHCCPIGWYAQLNGSSVHSRRMNVYGQGHVRHTLASVCVANFHG